ncbi:MULTISPECIES: cytochrome P450 [unclassified Nocardioides]|uniref:cytochrome P450 n=1 Tax=unclassified Nocardioides TaxID=2615069 RepID=UPI0006FC8510|nr:MULTISPECIES: cytochrome P450 [unclassified Nocardioides]KRA29479.1 cytochrome [Nocardioides sp. Root614]KRA88346.1 cytochrome [Nocardioides sp. Root682]
MTITAGEIDLFDPVHVEDPYALYRHLRDTSPVHRVRGTDFHLVSNWDLVHDAVTRPEDFSSRLHAVMLENPGGAPLTLEMDGAGTIEQVLATADDPIHKAHRGFVMNTLGKRIRALDTAVAACAEDLWTRYAVHGEIDWADAMADRLPLAMVATLLGLPAGDVPQLLSWAYDSTELLGGVVAAGRIDALVTASFELHTYLDEKFTHAQTDPGDDLMGILATACRDGELAASTAVLMLLQIVGAGGESTAGLVSTAARLLATRPDLQTQLRADPTLVDPFLDECLRLESPFRGHYRHVPVETTLGDTVLPAGGHLLLLWGSANRDPSRFPLPDRLDLARPGIRQHLAFGKGTHFCVGSALARMEATAAIRALLENTRHVELTGPDAARWVPSIFVRRHATLRLAFD